MDCKKISELCNKSMQVLMSGFSEVLHKNYNISGVSVVAFKLDEISKISNTLPQSNILLDFSKVLENNGIFGVAVVEFQLALQPENPLIAQINLPNCRPCRNDPNRTCCQ